VGRGHVALSEYNVAAMAAFPTPPGERRTLDLLARIRDDDPSAWTELYDLYHDELLFTIRMNLGARLRAALESEDVLQSVALEAFEALPRFEDRGGGSLRALLHRMVLNKIRDRADTFGAQKRRGGVPLTDSIAAGLGAPEPTYRDAERFEQLERGLLALPDDMREVLVLRKIEGLSSQEAAARLGRSDAATRKLYSRALARLSLVLGARDPT
jgi:RNA polymerase sigma-70 factor (ECF subfamily)